MSLKSGTCIDNNDLKFLELRKYLVSNENNGINCVAIDNKQEMVFVSNDKQLIAISINHLLNFVWNKSVINEIADKFEHFRISLNFSSHLISISAKGFGTKLAVCGSNNENESPFIAFFDLNSVYRTKENSQHYSRINLINSKGLITDICWHPEICDNQFGCCLNDGSIFIISIGDIESKTTTILSYMPSSINATSLCWSPKGKQFVVGFKGGYFSQYKLAGGHQSQEVKKTVLPGNLTDYNILSIKWIVSSLFAIACTKDLNEAEKDTHIILVSTPSKDSAQFVDFGAICLDNYEVNDSYRVNLLHYENMILCSTSMASEVAVIGCESEQDMSILDKWCQWMLDDSSRIDLPMDKDGNDTYLRGIGISKGTQNTFKVSANEVYGGTNCPVLMVYNSSGILLPYLIIEKSGHIKVPEAPKIVKPTAVPSSTSQTPTQANKPLQISTPIQSSITFNPQKPTVTSSASSIPSFGSPFSPIVSSTSVTTNPTPKPIQQQAMIQTNQVSKPFAGQPIAAQQSSTPDISTPKSNLVVPNVKQTTNTVGPDKGSTSTETQISTVSPNDLYLDAMTEQINEFNKLMSALKKKFSQIETKIGEKEEQVKLRASTRLIEDVLSEIKENFKNCSKDTTILQASLIESFSLIEEAKSIIDRNTDPKYRFLLKQRALDPITARRMEEINSLNEYITIQLRELDAKFEQEWIEWLEKRKSNKTSQSAARVHPNATCELIYKALANNQRVINCLRLQLQKLEGFSSPHSLRTKSRLIKEQKSEGLSKKDIEKLSQSLKKSSIIDIPEEPLNEPVFKLKTISKEKKSNLKEFLENRPNVPVRRSIDVINSSSSRFISAIEKIKQKQKTINKGKPDIDSNVSIEATNLKPNQNSSTSVDKTTVVTPVVEKHSANDSSVKTPVEKPVPVPVQKLDFKLPSPSFSSTSSLNTQLFPSLVPDSSKPNVVKSTDSFQITSKPLITPSFGGESSLIKSSQKTIPATSSIKTKSGTESTPKEGTAFETTSTLSNIPKTVSFGNTTIINPVEATSDSNDFKLDTIAECTENSETVSSTTVSSPFVSFQGFGGNLSSVGSALPKLSFNLSQTNTSLPSLKGDSETIPKSKDPLPKYEDISPPSTPQTKHSNEPPIAVADSTVTVVETDSSKPFSTLKATLSAKPLNQVAETDSQKSADSNSSITTKASQSQPITTTTPKTVSGLTFASEPSVITSSVVTTISSSIPTTTTTLPSFTSPPLIESANNTTLSPKPLFGSQPQVSQKSEPVSSPFSQSTFGQTPFASNSFSFGNVSSNATSATPTFGQGFSFGGSTGFGQKSPVASNPTSTAGTSSLTFGQQTSVLNNLSFCGLGGRPTPENANKNVFGGSFSTSSAQTSLFTSTSQSSPFTVKPSPSGAFGGSFTSGSGVAQAGFGAFQKSPQQSTSVFGGSPVFGGAQQSTFGGSPTFGSGSPQQSAFGGSPTFGGAPALGSMSTFGSTQSSTSFGGSGFVNAASSSLSFGAIASSVQQTPQGSSPFSGQFSFNSPSSAFGSTDQTQGVSFTQRRK